MDREEAATTRSSPEQLRRGLEEPCLSSLRVTESVGYDFDREIVFVSQTCHLTVTVIFVNLHGPTFRRGYGVAKLSGGDFDGDELQFTADATLVSLLRDTQGTGRRVNPRWKLRVNEQLKQAEDLLGVSRLLTNV